MKPKNKRVAMWIFEAFPRAFKKETYSDWVASLYFNITGMLEVTVIVGEGGVKIYEGNMGRSNCSITMGPDIFFGLVEKSVSKNTAYKTKLLTADNSELLRKFFKAFKFSHLESVYKDADIRELLEKELNSSEKDLNSVITEIQKRYGSKIKKFFKNKLHSWNYYEDAYSTWLMEVYDSLFKFRWESGLRSWCYRIAGSVVKRTFREIYKRGDLTKIHTTMMDNFKYKQDADTLKNISDTIELSFEALMEDNLAREEKEIVDIYRELKDWRKVAHHIFKNTPEEKKLKRESTRLKRVLKKVPGLQKWEVNSDISPPNRKLVLSAIRAETLKLGGTEKKMLPSLLADNFSWRDIVKEIHKNTSTDILIDRESARLRQKYHYIIENLKNITAIQVLVDRVKNKKGKK